MAFRQRNGQATPRDREPERVQPVPEEYEGVNFPYRGTEQHGVPVPPNAKYDTREFEYEQPDTKVGYLPEDKEPDPIPVRIVQESARERLEWRCIQGSVGDAPVPIVDRLEARRSLAVKVMPDSPNGVYVGPTQDVKPYTGFYVAPGEKVELRSTERVWAISAVAGTVATYCVMYEFGVEL